jgi:hypothetical protein
MSSDIAITQAIMPTGVAASSKPNWLLSIEDKSGKTVKTRFFISLDRPDTSNNGFVAVKGIFSDLDEDDILKTFKDLLTSAGKDLYCDLLIPHHKVSMMRSLVFRQK